MTGNKPGEETALGDGPDQGGKRKVFVDEHLLSGKVGVTRPTIARLLGEETRGCGGCKCDGCGDCWRGVGGGMDGAGAGCSGCMKPRPVPTLWGCDGWPQMGGGLFASGFLNRNGELLNDHKRLRLVREDTGVTVREAVGHGTRGVVKVCRSKLLISGVGHDGDLQNTKI